MKELYLSSGGTVRLAGERLGDGRQGMVFGVADTDLYCVKLYLQPTPQLARRFGALIKAPPVTWRGDAPDHLHLAWPRATVRDEERVVRGLLIPRIHGSLLVDLLVPGMRERVLEEPTWRTNLAVAARLARLFGRLHAAGVVVGDVSPNNVMLDRAGRVTLIDCDTVQFAHPRTGKTFPAENFTPEYLPPEALPNPPFPLSPGHDLFGLAILVCQLLMEGDHPFEGVPASAGGASTVEDNIKLGNNRIVRPERLVRRPDTMPVELLPPRVRELAWRCFEDGRHEPDRRPSAGEWAAALGQAGFELMGCRRNPWHAYPSSLRSCVWCDRIDAGHIDHFPSPVAAPPRPRRAPAAAPQRPPGPVRPAGGKRPYPRPAPPATARPAAPSGTSGSGLSTGLTVALVLAAVVMLIICLAAA